MIVDSKVASKISELKGNFHAREGCQKKLLIINLNMSLVAAMLVVIAK